MLALQNQPIHHPNDACAWSISRCALCILIMGFIARVYLFAVNPIINPDGFLYIQQSKALYFGLFDQVLACYKYLSPYPILIALFYRVLGDWVAAGQWVNIIFGTLAIMPLYWLLKRFFTDNIACLAVIVFALLPSYVEASTWIIRGPLFWFFSLMGLFLFVLILEKPRSSLLVLSSTCFAIGAWSRIEGSLFIIVSAIFLLFVDRKNRLKNLIAFSLPYIVAGMAGAFASHLTDIDLMALLKPGRILTRPMEFFTHYEMLREQLKTLYGTQLVLSADYFFPRVRNLIWWIALGTFLTQAAETLLYLFLILLIIGFVSWMPRIKSDRRITYLFVLFVLSIALLYSQIIVNWVMNSRFLLVFLFPAFVFIGAGIGQMISLLKQRFQFGDARIYLMVGAIFLALLLPKTIFSNYDKGKLVFREIGSFIAARENDARTVSVCGAFKRVNVIHFYANLGYPGVSCFDRSAIIDRLNDTTIENISKKDFDYFVWNQGTGNRQSRPVPKDLSQRFTKLKEWPSERVGKLILYEVVK